MLSEYIRQEYGRNLLTKLAGLISLPVLNAIKGRMDPRLYNGASLVGLQGVVIKSHGGADELAFANAIRLGMNAARMSVPDRIAHLVGSALQGRLAEGNVTSIYSRILATGSYLPRQVLTNADLEARLDTNDAWIRERTGISERHISAADETVSMMAEQAARSALAAGGLAPEDLDLIIVGTTTPDQIFPNCATMLQERLGIAGIGAFSLEAACSGFIYALSVADKFIRMGMPGGCWWWGGDDVTPGGLE